jgi:hypothetical protein
VVERKTSRRSRSGGSKSGGSKRSTSRGSGRSGSKGRSTTGSSSQRTPTAYDEEPPSRHSPSGGDDDDNGNMSKEEESQTGGKEMGRPPADEPDVYVFVPQVHVGELCIDVERLEAHLALRAQVANLVNLVAGVHVAVDKVKIDLKDVDAEAEMKVRLENTYNILDRTLSTLDENPQVVEKLLDTADTAVQETGRIGQEATKPGGTLSELTSGVGDSLGNLSDGIGDTLSSVADKANPKKLVGGNGSAGGQSAKGNVSSNGLSKGKTAATAGAAGVAGLVAALLGRRGNGPFRRRSALQKIIGQK